MPRKRATRVQPLAKPKPTAMTVAESLSNKERQEQLDVFLKDFDSRVKKVLKDMDKTKRSLLTFIQTRYEKQIFDLPKNIRDMTIEEFARCGGTIEAANAMEDSKQKRMADILNFKWTEQSLEDITEEGSEASVPASVKPTIARASRRQGKTTCQASRTANKFLMKTPAGTAAQPFWGQTPLFTPKFDPNLSLTPENVRDVKPGERLLMSLAGSPVHTNRAEPVNSCVNKDDIAQGWSDIAGVQLTPNRIEQMLKLMSKTINQQ